MEKFSLKTKNQQKSNFNFIFFWHKLINDDYPWGIIGTLTITLQSLILTPATLGLSRCQRG
jgi:hypothetical protein